MIVAVALCMEMIYIGYCLLSNPFNLFMNKICLKWKWVGFELTTWVAIDTDCIDNCRSTTIRSRPRPIVQGIKLKLHVHCIFLKLLLRYTNNWTHDINVTFNNISVIKWPSVLLVEETGVPWKPPTYNKSLTNFITWCYIEYTSQ